MNVMTQEDRPAALSEDAVRQAVNRWSEQGSFRIKYLGDKIFLDEVVPRASYTIRLDTQYDERSISRASVPYSGGPVDDIGQPPGAWDFDVRAPVDFGNRTETLPVPHTERIGLCDGCTGLGTIECAPCHGTGRANCPHCQGRGYRERKEAQQVRDAAGNMTTQWVTHQDNCTCMGGRVTCGNCSGNGRKTCARCSGTGQTKSFEQLTVCFRHASKKEIVDATNVPDQLVGGAKGDVVMDLRAPRIDSPAAVSAQADPRIAALLREANAVDERSARILLQHLQVERIAVHEVAYRYAGVTRRLWVYGNDQEVYAPDAPWLWKRAATIAAAIVGGVAALVGVLIFALSR